MAAGEGRGGDNKWGGGKTNGGGVPMESHTLHII